ncbi:class I SAM-dependent methyltransferase [Halobaculum sp. MBLA0147]|uniref:class I SAM-dependent methyltransferase n=1 Tax=Halobaculum sp. MBLA0147 TaxID=3079934 RepID=UPI003523308A
MSHSVGRHGPGDVRFFDRIAPLYDVAMPPVRPADLRAGFRLADRSIRRVLDAAGGTGRAARAVRVATDGTWADGHTRAGPSRTDAETDSGSSSGTADVTVLDVSAGMLGRAAADGLAAVRGDARRPPIRPGAVDAVVIADALHHVPDWPAALTALSETVAPGGVVVVREFDPTTLRGWALARLEHLAGMDSVFATPEDIREQLRAAGLRAYTLQPGFGYTVVGVVPRGRGDERHEPTHGGASTET